jgi:hypothetical protein
MIVLLIRFKLLFGSAIPNIKCHNVTQSTPEPLSLKSNPRGRLPSYLAWAQKLDRGDLRFFYTQV